MKKILDIINRLWNVCGQMEVGALLTWGSGINVLILAIQIVIDFAMLCAVAQPLCPFVQI